MQTAQQLVGQKKFRQAEKILSQYVVNHPDITTVWFYAQTGHWAHHDQIAAKNFKRALNQAPDNTKLRLDYARMLFESERYNESKKQLNKVLQKDDKEVEANMIKSNIEFWYGQITPAKKDIKNVTDQFPDNPAAAGLKESINQSTAPYLKYTAGYLNDDQPIQSIGTTVEAGVFYSWLLSPKVQITDQDLYTNRKWNFTLWANVSNKFLFGKTGTDLSFSVGAFKNFSAGVDWTGDATIHQKLYKFLSVQLEAERRPYVSTISSTSLSLMQNNITASLILDKSNSWTAQAAYRYQFYNDKNPIQTAYVWALSQPIKASVFEFRFGYGYNYSTSKQSRFTSTKTVNELLAGYTADQQIAGVYSPYFTLIKQHTHSAIVVIGIKPLKFMDIGLKADVGLYAQAQNPYLYLDQNSVDGVFINSGFAKQVFHPYKLSASVNFKIGRKVTLGADYTYTSGFFYSNHYTSVHFAISFLKHAN